MLDIFMLALGLAFFVAAVGYTYACEQALKEHDHDLRLFTRRSRLVRPAVLSHLRPAAARAVLIVSNVTPRKS
jgi:hypothetical protein